MDICVETWISHHKLDRTSTQATQIMTKDKIRRRDWQILIRTSSEFLARFLIQDEKKIEREKFGQTKKANNQIKTMGAVVSLVVGAIATSFFLKGDDGSKVPAPQWVLDLQNDVEKLRKEKHDWEEKQKVLCSPENYKEHERGVFEKFLQGVKKYGTDDMQAILTGKHVAFMGNISAGKSSIINQIFGEPHLCKVGMGKTTEGETAVGKRFGLTFHDVFGDSESISYLEFSNLMFLKRMTLVVITYSNDPSNCERLIRTCDSMGVRFICVRNKLDDYDEETDDLTVDDWKNLEFIRIQGLAQKNPSNFEGLYFISANNKLKAQGDLFDWDNFIQKMQNI